MSIDLIIVGTLALSVSQLCLLLHVGMLNRRLKAAEAFIDDAFPILFPMWLEKQKENEK